jgi:hypothetical protein
MKKVQFWNQKHLYRHISTNKTAMRLVGRTSQKFCKSAPLNFDIQSAVRFVRSFVPSCVLFCTLVPNPTERIVSSEALTAACERIWAADAHHSAGDACQRSKLGASRPRRMQGPVGSEKQAGRSRCRRARGRSGAWLGGAERGKREWIPSSSQARGGSNQTPRSTRRTVVLLRALPDHDRWEVAAPPYAR